MGRWFTVAVRDGRSEDEFNKLRMRISSLPGVESVNDCFGSGRSAQLEAMLEKVGEVISGFENHGDLTCPLRALRWEVEETLGRGVCQARFDPRDVMVRKGG